jgi:hypothetical protein
MTRVEAATEPTFFYCGSCREEVTATADKRCRKCGGLTLGPSRARFQQREDGELAMKSYDPPVFPTKQSVMPTPLEILESLARRLEEEIASNEQKRVDLLAASANAKVMLIHIRRALGTSTKGAGPGRNHSSSAGAIRWSGGLWGKCKNCGTTEKAHARKGYCVDCIDQVTA